MQRHRTRLFALVALGLGAAMMLTGCASAEPGSDARLDDPPAPPAASGPVLAQGTVLQTEGAAAMLCLGGVAESYPPQCSGPEVVGWDWDAVDGEETASGTTWGAYAMRGAWDGTTFTTGEPAVLLALFDPAPTTPNARLDPANAGSGGSAELIDVQNEIHELDGIPVLTSRPENGWLFVSVPYDDGSYQRWFDAVYGDGLVAVESALVEVEVEVETGGEREGAAPDDADTSADRPSDAGEGRHWLSSPASPGLVTITGGVLQHDGGEPVVCVGAQPMIAPPTCGGPELVGWRWKDVAGETDHGPVRTAHARLTGTYDGSRLTLTEPPVEVPLDADGSDTTTDDPVAQGAGEARELRRIQQRITDAWESSDGVLMIGVGEGWVHIDVVYDDGSLQRQFDERFGPRMVRVTSWLQDA